MHDLKWLIDNLAEANRRIGKRHQGLSFDEVARLAEVRRALVSEHNTKKHTQNQLSASFPRTGTPEEQAAYREQVKGLKAEIAALELRLGDAEKDIETVLMVLPNLPQEVVPDGKSETDNVVAKTWGEPVMHAFEALEHDVLGERLGILDFEAATRISGGGFALYRGAGARMERALASYMLDLHTEKHGYEEVLTPFIVQRDCMIGTGQLPKFEDDAYKTTDGFYLIPTAEVPVTNIDRGQMLDGADLPRRMTAFSPCYRKEAGSYGREVRGLTRTHQFQKVELVQYAAPEDSDRAHEELTASAEAVLEGLGLAYRRMLLCGGDMGFGSTKTYDLEVWLPAQKRWREISSCSNYGDFQSRRADIRYRPEPGAKPRFVHTLNGSALAIGRTVMAILEVYQTADGNVVVPEALRPYMKTDLITRNPSKR